MRRAEEYIERHWLEAIEDLKRYCRQPSISAQKVGLEETAVLTAELLRLYGVEPRIMPVAGGAPPVVYGELAGASPYTLLIYNHYDVQPPEPLDLWTTPPFDPVLTEGRLVGRGTSDDKGDIVARLLAVKALLETEGQLPVSVKFVIEGEEEVGSPSLAAFVEENRELLRADACLWEGGRVGWEDRPEIVLGLKGIICVELRAQGAIRDLHSSLGAIVPNPAWRLVWALNAIKSPDETVLIEGFYDDVRPPSPDLIEAIRAMPSSEEQLKRDLGIDRFVRGLSGEALQQHNILQPACTINGILSGYTGEGSKTVLPSEALAKIDFRLVPDQRPDDILQKLRRHLNRRGFTDITICSENGERPARTPLDSHFARVLAEAARKVYGDEPVVKPNMTGSGPMFPFVDTLGLPAGSCGVSNPDSRPHAPDENIRLADFILGAKYVSAILQGLKP